MTSFMGGNSSLSGYGGARANTGFGSKGASTGGSLRGDIIPKGHRLGQLQQFTPEMMKLFSQLFGHVGPDSFLSRLAEGDEGTFEEMEAPAHRMFQGQLGQLASRFSGMGTGGRRSSGFQNTATSAYSNFAQDLASKRQELSRSALGDIMKFSEMLLGQKPQDRFLTEKQQKPNYWADIGGQLAGALPMALAVL